MCVRLGAHPPPFFGALLLMILDFGPLGAFIFALAFFDEKRDGLDEPAFFFFFFCTPPG